MTIVQRLRDWDHTTSEQNRIDMLNAADEIDRLQDELTLAKKIANGNIDAKFAAWNELGVIIAENTQLQALIERVIQWDTFDSVATRMQQEHWPNLVKDCRQLLETLKVPA